MRRHNNKLVTSKFQLSSLQTKVLHRTVPMTDDDNHSPLAVTTVPVPYRHRFNVKTESIETKVL